MEYLSRLKSINSPLFCLCVLILMLLSQSALSGYDKGSLGICGWEVVYRLSNYKKLEAWRTMTGKILESEIAALPVDDEGRALLSKLLQGKAEGDWVSKVNPIKVISVCDPTVSTGTMCAMLYGINHWGQMRDHVLREVKEGRYNDHAIALTLALLWEKLPTYFKAMKVRIFDEHTDSEITVTELLKLWYEHPFPKKAISTGIPAAGAVSTLPQLVGSMDKLKLVPKNFNREGVFQKIFTELLEQKDNPVCTNYDLIFDAINIYHGFQERIKTKRDIAELAMAFFPFRVSGKKKHQIKLLNTLLTNISAEQQEQEKPIEQTGMRVDVMPELRSKVFIGLKPELVKASSEALVRRLHRQGALDSRLVKRHVLSRVRVPYFNHASSLVSTDTSKAIYFGKRTDPRKSASTERVIDNLIEKLKVSKEQDSWKLFCTYTRSDWCHGEHVVATREDFNIALQMLLDEQRHPGETFARVLRSPYSYDWSL